jgi:hypothetical protein
LSKHSFKECGILFLVMTVARATDVIKAEILEVVTVATKKDLIKASQTATTGGRKFDGGKPRYGLLPPLAMKATAEVLTFGAEKYEPDNWKHVPESKTRYFDALERHVWAWKMGEQMDPESGMHHLAHALCCLMFLYEHDVKYSKED